MAKKLLEVAPIEVTYDEITELFEQTGGSISEDSDIAVLNAINELPCTDALKIKLLVQYSRDLERAIHYLRK